MSFFGRCLCPDVVTFRVFWVAGCEWRARISVVGNKGNSAGGGNQAIIVFGAE